jgi:nucleoside-diphosphate-sugar epimerase
MNTLVTGATGFIGSHLVKELVREKHSVRALVLPGEDTSSLERQGVTVWRGDLLKRESLRGVCNDIDVVFHLAARVTDWGTKKQFYDAIYTATKNLIEEASGNAVRFVYVSSIAALGCNRDLRGVKETDPPQKSGIPYNDAKLDTETLVKSLHDPGGMACTIVRPANVTGPGSVWVRDVLDKMKGILPLVGGGENSSSFVYIDNLVDGIILAGTKEIAKGNTYHFRDDWDASWKRYLDDLGSFIGKKPSGSVPFPLAFAIAWVCDRVCTPLGLRPPLSRFGVYIMGRDYDVDTTLTREQLGWRTKVPYEEAMKKIGEWVKEVYSKP